MINIRQPERRVTLGMSPHYFENQKDGDFYEVVCKTCLKPVPLNERWRERKTWLLLGSRDPDNSYLLAITRINEHQINPENVGHETKISKSNRELVDMLAYEHDHLTVLPRSRHKS